MLEYENSLIKEGYRLIAGIDEAGRGPLAGPVTVAVCIMPLDADKIIDGVNDSKKLTPRKREELYDKIINTATAYSIVNIGEKVIDEINILNATKLGMKKCLENIDVTPDYVLIDAVKIDSEIPYSAIIHGDALSYSIACASILAKVSRDRLMTTFDEKYQGYGFAKHKGYGTKLHKEMLLKYGPCEIHRPSFLKKILKEAK